MDENTRAAAIEADNERWRVWLSDTRTWWAARKDALTADELGAGAVPFLQADDLDELRQKIEAEEQLTAHPAERGVAPVTLEKPAYPTVNGDLHARSRLAASRRRNRHA